jgi:uncharacterized protein (DUF4415 family)
LPDVLKKLMRTKKMKKSGEAVEAMLAKIEHAVNHPELYPVEPLPEEELSLESIDLDVNFDIDVDFDFDFSAPVPERKPGEPAMVISAPGTKKVTIRIPNRIIDAFKANTKVSGGRYQTKMIRALEKAAMDLPR